MHLGCGSRFLSGFVHVDINQNEILDYVAPLHDLQFINDETVSEIYSSHAFEYYDRVEAMSVLREWWRVLENGGQVFLSVPSWTSLMSIYQVTNSLDAILGPLFGKWKNSDITLYHKSVWDSESLSKALEMCGFSSVKSFNPVEYLAQYDVGYDDFSLAFFPHMDRNGIQVSLCLTAAKTL